MKPTVEAVANFAGAASLSFDPNEQIRAQAHYDLGSNAPAVAGALATKKAVVGSKLKSGFTNLTTELANGAKASGQRLIQKVQAGPLGNEIGAVGPNVRRTYLNNKYGRTGNLNYDITLRGYLEKVNSLDVSSNPGEAVFYSGWNPSGVSNRKLGEALLVKRWTTLEQTPGGKWLDQEKLYGSPKRGDFLDPKDADKVWARLSQNYALGVKKSTTAFVNGADPERVFYKYEYPILKDNNIKIDFRD